MRLCGCTFSTWSQRSASGVIPLFYRRSTAVLLSFHRRSTVVPLLFDRVFLNGLTALLQLSAAVWKVFLTRTVCIMTVLVSAKGLSQLVLLCPALLLLNLPCQQQPTSHIYSRRQKVPIYCPFPFNFRPVAVQSPFVFNPFYGQPVRSINQVNSLGSARN